MCGGGGGKGEERKKEEVHRERGRWRGEKREAKRVRKGVIIYYTVWSCFPQPAYLSMLTTFKRKANETSTKVSRSAIGLLTRLRAGCSPLSIR